MIRPQINEKIQATSSTAPAVGLEDGKKKRFEQGQEVMVNGILVLAAAETTAIVKRVARQLGQQTTCVRTVEQALRALDSSQSFGVMITAIGREDDERIFDDDAGDTDEEDSPLIAAALKKATRVIIFR